MESNKAHEGKHLNLTIDDPQHLYQVTRALANPIRLNILKLLGQNPMMSINNIADSLNIPISTVALAIRTLEDAGVIVSENEPGIHGMLKLSARKVDTLAITLDPHKERTESVLTFQMPIGGYSRVGNIKPTCGLASSNSILGEDDNPRTFYQNNRFDAQLLWFRQGFVEYLFGVLHIHEIKVLWIEVSFEACSEAPMYRDPWKSDISVYINEQKIGVWTSPADCGEHRGRLNPEWWSDLSTQHGFLKCWRVDGEGTLLDGIPVSAVTIDALNLEAHDSISLRIAVEEDAKHVGGVNLFGQHFGDFDQDIIVRLGYQVKDI